MNDPGIVIPVIAILSIFIAAPAIVFSFIYHSQKDKKEIEKMRAQQELLELEIEKEKIQLLKLEAENKKYDSIIYKESPNDTHGAP
jgi:hypothetical protein